MSTSVLVSDDLALSVFTVPTDTPPHEHVAAVVAWCGGDGPRESLWQRLRRRIGRRGGPASPASSAARHHAPGWTGATDPGGPREVLHDRVRGRVRVAGREFACPTDGRTLVLLVDHRAAPGATTVTEHAIVVPGVPRPAGMLPAARERPAPPADVLPALLCALVSDPATRDVLPAGVHRLARDLARRRR